MKKFFKENKFIILCIMFFLTFSILLGKTVYDNFFDNKPISKPITDTYKEVEPKPEEDKLAIVDKIDLEINSELPTITSFFTEEIADEYTVKYYLNNEEITLEEFTTKKDDINYLTKLNKYKVCYTINDITYTSQINVIDTTSPTVTLKDVSITEGDSYSAKNFLNTYEDNSGSSSYTISYSDKKYSAYKSTGIYDVEIKVCDEHKNCTEQTAKLTIKEFVLQKVKTITQEVVTKTENLKYGVKKITTANITYDVYNDGSKKEVNRTNEKSEIDQSTYNGTVATLKEEGINTYNTLSSTRDTILSTTNSYRTELNVSNLVIDNTLSIMATIRAMEIAYSGVFSHERPDGRDWSTMWSDYLGSMPTGTIIGENLAYGYQSDAAACAGWRDSKGHYENMVNPKFTKIGIGKYTFNGKTYWVQLFQG